MSGEPKVRGLGEGVCLLEGGIRCGVGERCCHSGV